MKNIPHTLRSNHSKPSYFGHIFYWLWECTPRHGFPDRSWMIITVAQFAYFLLPIALCTLLFSDDTVRVLCEANDNLKYLPIATVFVIMVWRNLCIYNKRKYQQIKEYYMQVSPVERIRRKRHYLLFVTITVIVIVMEVWLFNLYYERCISYRYKPLIEIRGE